MNILEGSGNATEAERLFNQAAELCRQAKDLDVRSSDYLEAVLKVIGLCQTVISIERQHDDAHVMLANAFYRLHLQVYPKSGDGFPLKLAAATIQHWSDQPIRQHRSAMSVEAGCRIYDVIAGELSEIEPECADREDFEMRYLESELYSRALVANPRETITA